MHRFVRVRACVCVASEMQGGKYKEFCELTPAPCPSAATTSNRTRSVTIVAQRTDSLLWFWPVWGVYLILVLACA